MGSIPAAHSIPGSRRGSACSFNEKRQIIELTSTIATVEVSFVPIDFYAVFDIPAY